MTEEDLAYLNATNRKLRAAKKELKAANEINTIKFLSGTVEGNVSDTGDYKKEFKQIKKILIDIAAKTVLELQHEFDGL